MKRAVLIMPYYGKLPPYFGFYLKSVEGKCFDVLFVTDLDVGEHPSNVKIVGLSFAQVRELSAKKLGVKVGLETPKKFCDFKPMYGKIFEDYIVKYDYWMFGDCDLVYGNKFNDYISEVLSSDYDVVSMRKPWVSGPLCVLRNDEKTRTLFMRATNWQEVAGERGPNNLWDECGACWHPQLEAGTLTMSDCEKLRDSFGAVVFRSQDIKFRHEDDITEIGLAGHVVSMSSEGSLSLDQKEILIYHLNAIKTRRFFTCPAAPYRDVGEYWIDETGFYSTRALWRLRRIINPCRKMRALIASFRENGLRHWIRRLAK